MADTEPTNVDGGDGQTVTESGDATSLDNAQAEPEESMAIDEEVHKEPETAGGQTGCDIADLKTDEFVLAGDSTFEADIIDETGMDDEGDEEDAKENHEGDVEHEGDGDHEDMKDEAMEEDDDEEEEDDVHDNSYQDPNVLPQVNVTALAQRKWQVKVYPLKPSDFTNGQISRVFKHARESLLYLQSPASNARGKGEMYVSSANQAVRCVLSLMRLEYFYPEINVEIIKKNDEGAIEEKAYLRFDSKLTQILTLRPVRRGPGGRKRDRMIGSVFLKNLPAGTTKDTLRVMFPFAQEINYNPEKFKECTARLVLPYRSHVIPCLKAFAKVELGGNVLELYPLTKRKRTRTDEDGDVSDAKQRKKSDEPKEETGKGSEESKPEAKKPPVKKPAPKKNPVKNTNERFKIKTGPAKDRNLDEKDKKLPLRKPFQSNRPASKFTNQRKDQKSDFGTNKPKLVGGKERNSTFTTPPGPKPARGRGGNTNRPRQDRSPASSTRSFRSERSSRDFRSPPSSVVSNRSSRPRGVGGSGDHFNRRSQGSVGRTSFSGSGYSSGYGLGSLSASDASLAVSAEATKEMMLLQNQLGMAIKNQLAMLNQTTMAVEQAKRGLGSATELQSSSSSLLSRPSPKGARTASSRRSVDQYRPGNSMDNVEDHYEHERPRPKATAGRKVRGGRGGLGDYVGRGGSGRGASVRGGSGRGASGRGGSSRGASGRGASGRGGGGRGGGGATGGYSKRMATTSYRDDDWDNGMSNQYHDPYASSQDYGYDAQSSSRNLTSFGSSSRLSYDYSQDNDYSGYY